MRICSLINFLLGMKTHICSYTLSVLKEGMWQVGKQFYILEQTQHKKAKPRYPKQTYDFNPEMTKVDSVGRRHWGDPLSYYLPSQRNDLISQNLEKGQAAVQLAPFRRHTGSCFLPATGQRLC